MAARRRAALYARQSITRDGSAGLDVQIEACREAAKRLKVDVVVELVEPPSTSGYRNRGRSRPKFGELLELIRTGEVDCVIAFKTDRLFPRRRYLSPFRPPSLLSTMNSGPSATIGLIR